ncbi:MAG: terminase small subunit, partial [Dongiaceae bacterium]
MTRKPTKAATATPAPDAARDPIAPDAAAPSPTAQRRPCRHRPLSGRHRRFIEEYLLDPSPARAARRAGYSENFARVNAYSLMKRPDVAAAIREGQAAAQARAAITVDRIIAELAKLAFADPRDLFTADGRMKPIHELDAANAASIASLEVLVLGGGSRSAAAKAGMEKVR